MTGAEGTDYDVAIVGAGPVGSVCALAHARRGARVALLEANPKVASRIAGEWLHPPAARILRDIGIDVERMSRGVPGAGFAVFPGDGSEPIMLPYPDGSTALVCDHALLVSSLREAIDGEAGIDLILPARASSIEGQRLFFSQDGSERSIGAARIVGADGRASVVRKSLELSTNSTLCSWMLGVTLQDANLPFEGYGHVVMGGPGPMMVYGLANGCVRIHVDVPRDRWNREDRTGFVSEACAGALPGDLGPSFIKALHAGRVHAAANQLSPRLSYGSPGRILIGDAAGHYHPMTAVGMTLGFGDAVDLAESDDFRQFTKERFRAVRVPELLAMGLYEVLADHRNESVVLRNAVYRGWRRSSLYRERTMRILACEERSVSGMAFTFGGTVAYALARESLGAFSKLARPRIWPVFRAVATRLFAFQLGFRQLRIAIREGREESAEARRNLARAFVHSMPGEGGPRRPAKAGDAGPPDAAAALDKAARRLVRSQGEDGEWEGEMVWCPMLTAQYALLHHVIGRPLDPGRRRRVLRSFARTRLPGGSWGLHEHSSPHLFVTVLVYVAARTLGVERDDPLIAQAREFIREEDVLNVPSWGKFWLAILNLYDWRGVNAILPELWRLPRWVPLHPSNWYCHTRLIYMAMASIYARRFQVPVTPVVESLREDLYPQGFASARFPEAATRLRDADTFAKPTAWLKAGYRLARLYERLHGRSLRARCTDEFVRRIKWELQTTSHTSISPVSGLLNILSLWLHDPEDADCRQALAKLDGWIWEDEEEGLRVTGARSASWDTGFALQALAALPDAGGCGKALDRGAGFLLGEQVKGSFEGFRDAYRADPKGGWCFAGGWHGWPVSDCTAEALLGILAVRGDATDPAVVADAVAFILRSQNRDGGFGSYEARRSVLGLEWLNPAEMFGESMTESSFVECGASCIAALAACQDLFPEVAERAGAADAVSRGVAWLRRSQEADGAWRGVWGVQYIYGTLFGIRGLVASGARRNDPALRTACRWLLERQREDGGWGEHHSGCLSGRYVAHHESQVVQTAWALIALLEAQEPDWAAISRGAGFLVGSQCADGTWPKQDMAGVFFRTALLDYVLYRQYFPLHALGLYERRRRARQGPPAPNAGRAGAPASAEAGVPALAPTPCAGGPRCPEAGPPSGLAPPSRPDSARLPSGVVPLRERKASG